MNLIEKCAIRATIILMIAILVVGLFYSIYEHIDGFGIFSIMIGIIFFSFILDGHFRATSGSSSGSEAVITSMPHYLKVITSPIFIRMLPSLLTVIFSYLEKHKDKLDKAAAQELQQDIQRTLNSFKLGFENFGKHFEQETDNTPPANNKHKKT